MSYSSFRTMHTGQTDTTSVKCLINSISRFIHLVSCQNMKHVPFQKNFNNMVGVLKRLKPVIDDIVDYKIPLDENLCKECGELDMAVNEAREFMEKWSPKMSKIHGVLRSGPLFMKIWSSSMKICDMISGSLQSSSSTSVSASLEHFVQDLRCLKKDPATICIEEALRNQRENIEPCDDHFKRIIDLLSLTRNQELLKESIAVEKERLQAEANKMKGEVDEINQIVKLVCNIRDYAMKIECLEVKNGVAVPPYFRCPLSLELMLDPVIVASGQTYERLSIQKWLDHGLTVCPKTRQRLFHANLIPNYTVKAMIANWCQENGIKIPSDSEHNHSAQSKSPSDHLSQGLDHTHGFGSASLHSSNLTSKSSLQTGNAIEKKKGDILSRLSEESDGCESGRMENFGQNSPAPSYLYSRSESFSSSISSGDLIQAISKEISGISFKHDNTDGLSGEITNGFLTYPLNKESEISPGLSGKQIQGTGHKIDEIENGNNGSHSRAHSLPVSNLGSYELTTCHVHKLIEDLPLNKESEISPGLSGKQFQGTGQKIDEIENGNNDSHSRAHSLSVSNMGSYELTTSHVHKLIEYLPLNKESEISPVLFGKQIQGTGQKIDEIESGNNDSHSRAHSLPVSNLGSPELTASHVHELIEDLHSQSYEVQTRAAEELRLLTKNNIENRIIIGQCGAIVPLLSLLYSDMKITQEHAVTALLNLSINEDNKALIAEAGAIEPLIHVLKRGNNGAKENSAAALFSLSVIEKNKAKIGRSGAVKALVDLLGSGTLRGKKDAATALFNLSIFHENKARIVQAGAVKHLVQLMDPAHGMVDKAVALLANLSTIAEGQSAIAREGGIPLLVEIVESGSQRGKENAASVLLQLCLHSPKFCTLVLQEGAVPPLVALSQSGTTRAKEKAQQLLSHFRNQREGGTTKGKS